MVVIFDVDVACWAFLVKVRLVAMGNMSGGCNFVDVLGEGDWFGLALFYYLFVDWPVDVVDCVVVPCVFFAEICKVVG